MNKQLVAKEKKGLLRNIMQIVLGLLAVAFCVMLSLVMLQFVSKPEKMQAWMGKHQYVGWLAYVGMAMVQVIIALIPGEPVEIAGGYVFGAVEGTILYLIGATIGSLIVFAVVRKFGGGLLEVFFNSDKIKNVRFLQDSRKRNILLSFVFILPGTPKDLLCYFAGLTDIKIGVWFWVCSLGRLPSVVTSMLGGDALETKNYMNAVVVFAITIFISLTGALIYKGFCGRHDKNREKVAKEVNETGEEG